jgi:hypothetical protein
MPSYASRSAARLDAKDGIKEVRREFAVIASGDRYLPRAAAT